MTDTRNKFRLRAYLPLFFSVILLAGIYLGLRLRSNQTNSFEKRFFSIGIDRYDKFNDVLNYVYDSYVDSVSRDLLIEEAVENLLQNLDPHSGYIPASYFQEMNDPLMGSFEGIGVEFNMIRDTVVIINPIAGGPSEKAGILSGDRIIAVEGDPIAGVNKSTSEVVSLLKGKKGTEVNVSVLRTGVREPLEFRLVRDKIPSYSLDIAYMLDENIGYIRLNKFAVTTYQEFMSALNRLKSEGMTSLILDLRDNSGGYLDAAISISDELLEKDNLIVYTSGRKRPSTFAYARKAGGFETQPLVVLINEWSASASEIIAGAVQDNDRGLIIGRRSFGKGLVQEQVQMADGSAIRLTVARYFTPSGRSIQKPYENGLGDYHSDMMQRFLDGEFDAPENISFNDSLQFLTTGGRKVYGGGGIMPDVFIPLETNENMVFFNQSVNHGLIYRFAFDYADKNRNRLTGYGDASNFTEQFRVDDAMFEQFVAYTRNEGLTPASRSIEASEGRIRNYLKAYIGRNVFGNDAFFPVLHKIQPEVIQAVELLRNGFDLFEQQPS